MTPQEIGWRSWRSGERGKTHRSLTQGYTYLREGWSAQYPFIQEKKKTWCDGHWEKSPYLQSFDLILVRALIVLNGWTCIYTKMDLCSSIISGGGLDTMDEKEPNMKDSFILRRQKNKKYPIRYFFKI